MSQVPEESFTLVRYRNTFRNLRQFEHITVLGSDANGTHFQWDDSRGERHFGVISDLTPSNHRHISAASTAGATLTTDSDNTTWENVATITYTPPTRVGNQFIQVIVYGRGENRDGVNDARFRLMRDTTILDAPPFDVIKSTSIMLNTVELIISGTTARVYAVQANAPGAGKTVDVAVRFTVFDQLWGRMVS